MCVGAEITAEHLIYILLTLGSGDIDGSFLPKTTRCDRSHNEIVNDRRTQLGHLQVSLIFIHCEVPVLRWFGVSCNVHHVTINAP